MSQKRSNFYPTGEIIDYSLPQSFTKALHGNSNSLWTALIQVFLQQSQHLSARFSIQGRKSYIESRLVIAPTGQIWMHPPQNSQSNGCAPKYLISVMVPRPAGAKAFTSITWSQYRTQRRHWTQRFICVSIRGLKYSLLNTRFNSTKRLEVGVY